MGRAVMALELLGDTSAAFHSTSSRSLLESFASSLNWTTSADEEC